MLKKNLGEGLRKGATKKKNFHEPYTYKQLLVECLKIVVDQK